MLLKKGNFGNFVMHSELHIVQYSMSYLKLFSHLQSELVMDYMYIFYLWAYQGST